MSASVAEPCTPVRFASTSIHSADYSSQASSLDIVLRNGSTYRYFDLPSHLYARLLVALSKGHYIAAAIRPRFRLERLR